MNPSISTSFFSREAMLQRQARTIRSRKVHQSANKPILNIILEEDETRSPSPISDYSPSTSSGGSHTLGLKAKRRHANVSDIRIARDVPVHDDNDLSPLLLSSPRAAPSPPQSFTPSESPDSFRLTFTDVAFKFPHPPTPSLSSARYQDRTECASPTESISSLSSSPCSQHASMPLTPSTSDDESSFPSRVFNPRRAAIQPLVITKHNPRPSSPFSEISISPSLLQPFKNPSENLAGSAAITPLTSAFMDEESSESDPESDSEWYTSQFSQIISLYSPIPQSFPVQNSRPESMFISDDPAPVSVATRPSSKRRVSKALPPTPSSAASRRESAVLPICQLDSAPATKRASKRISIPRYPPPPVPSMSPTHLQVPSLSTSGKVLPHGIRRPPPRSSVPADCDFDLELAEAEDDDDSSSAFSFSMYEIDLDNGLEEVTADPESPGSYYSSQPSAYSQPSFIEDEEFGGQEVTFDLDYSMMLPLSLPTTPMDLEADIAIGLERLRNVEGVVHVEQSSGVVVDEQVQEQEQPQQEQEVVNDLFSPVSSSFSPPPSATFYAHSPSYFSDYPSPEPSAFTKKRTLINEEKILKSKWSSSTLGSVREEHEREQEHRRGASAKLRLYFGGQTSPAKSLSGKRTSQKVPATPTSPFSLLTPRKASQARSPAATPSPHSASPSASPHGGRAHSRGGSRNSNSDVMLIGYGGGVRRRGSVSTVSDVGSEDSSSSTSSSGLRRKPIPVEMFLRTAA